MCLVFSTEDEFFKQRGDVMQLTKKNMYNRCAMGLAALIWVFGLLAAGSDSIYMPWLNVAGAIIFLLASLWLGRTLPGLEASNLEASNLEASNRVVSSPLSVRTKGLAITFVKKQNSRVNTRYAGGWSTV
jgi:hypothetical protein